MSSYSAFITTYKEFLNDLIQSIPEEEKVHETLKGISEKEEKEVVTQFTEMFKDSSKIVNKDDSIFKETEFLNIQNYWDEFSPKTKDIIWQYLNTLYVLATTISSIPPNLLNAIENMAQQCAGEMENDGEMPDMSNLFAGMQNMLGNMMKNKH
tara:strand:+ start:465 stop:923 length:459 start_codon:yes stop_codon:yes gene_type:complete